MILVVAHATDDHAAGVLAALERRGHPASLIDTARFPSDASLTQRFADGRWGFEFTVDGRILDLGACRAAWWRRPQPFTLPSGLDPSLRSFAYAECHEAVAGLWAALDATWVNPPERDESAHHKPYQLATATRVGLPIPRTVITNDPEAARLLIADLGPGRTVYKTFLASEEHWRETRILRPEEMRMLELVRVTPVIFQEFIDAASDIRATVVGDRIFAASISPAPGGYGVDYRMDMEGARFEPTTLPTDTAHKIQALMRRLGLVYGAIDLRRTPAGEHVFLEVNPAGEWRFVEERTGQPITDAVAELLAEIDAH